MQNYICTTGVKTRIRDYERMLNTGVSLKGDEDMRFERELEKVITCEGDMLPATTEGDMLPAKTE